MHSRVCLHQVAFLNETTTAFIEHCRAIDVQNVTLVSPLLMKPGAVSEAQRALANGGPRVVTVNHPFATFPDLERDSGEATQKMLEAIGIAATLDASYVYLLTGGRGSLTWEQAADRFVDLITPCKERAAAYGISLLVENASAFNADIHIAHTFADTITLAQMAGIGLCIDFHACWMEAGLQNLLERVMPVTGLVQVSDYVLGDRIAPCRAVPGDGTVPLERLIAGALAAGYRGVFDLELVGPRIDAEGARPATARAAENLSTILSRLGA